MKLSESRKLENESSIKINGLDSITMISENILKIKYNPEAISPRKLSYMLEDKLFCKVNYFQGSAKVSLVEEQQQYMQENLKEFLMSLILAIPIFILSMIFIHV